ncbi:hypothetical protein N8T08_003079 [Aspergillus melleus]|uniref:Uncharacterized protein n=1 Tax=Aspergillus melleus TaxID=138277 RepID=A0ACC3B7F6_9EURO|nr:hypothetical protein N8T08_003079 [Aspergillus melleus]
MTQKGCPGTFATGLQATHNANLEFVLRAVMPNYPASFAFDSKARSIFCVSAKMHFTQEILTTHKTSPILQAFFSRKYCKVDRLFRAEHPTRPDPRFEAY